MASVDTKTLSPPSFTGPSSGHDVMLRPSLTQPDLATTSRVATYPLRMTMLLMAGDTLALALLLYALYAASLWLAPMFAPVATSSAPVIIGAVLSLYIATGLYRIRAMHPVEELRSMATTLAGLALSAPVLAYVTGASLAATALVAGAGALAVVVMPLARITTRIVGAYLPWWGLPAVVVGPEPATARITNTLNRWPEIGLRPVATCRPSQTESHTETGASPKALNWAQQHHVPYAILAESPDLSSQQRACMLARYSQFFEHVFCVPDTHGMIATWTTTATCKGLYGFGVRHLQHQPGARFIKRLIDIVGATVLLLVLSPLFALISAAIRLTTSGPVLYRQTRMGYEGQAFTVLKFCTMYADADTRLHELLARDPQCRAEYEQYHKLQNDPRVTAVGQWLRRYSLDELPQLVNVLRGDMSLVGPRAYMPEELFQMRGLNRVVLQAPPGITGLWQVSGRNSVSFSTRVDLDVHYVHNWSPWLDLYLLARTLPVVLSGRGAH